MLPETKNPRRFGELICLHPQVEKIEDHLYRLLITKFMFRDAKRVVSLKE